MTAKSYVSSGIDKMEKEDKEEKHDFLANRIGTKMGGEELEPHSRY